MIRTVLPFFVLVFSLPLQARDIRVRLLKHLQLMELQAEGLAVRDEVFDFAKISMDRKKSRWVIRNQDKKITLPLGSLTIDANRVQWKQEELPGKLHLVLRPDGGIDVITHLPLEGYLKGVVPNEMPRLWPIEALKAQAVAARSFAMQRMKSRDHLDYDVEASIEDQQFRLPTGLESQKIARVLEHTKDMVLADEKNEVLEALYHADCGGMTEVPSNVWGGEGKVFSHADCPHRSRRWEVEVERKSLVKKFADYFGLPRDTNLRSLQAVGRSSSGRVKDVRVDLSTGGVRQMSSQEFRKIIGYERVPSANFKISWVGPSLKIAGLGQGHGVGLCQLGARSLALQGKDFREILSFYYPRAQLVRMSKALATE